MHNIHTTKFSECVSKFFIETKFHKYENVLLTFLVIAKNRVLKLASYLLYTSYLSVDPRREHQKILVINTHNHLKSHVLDNSQIFLNFLCVSETHFELILGINPHTDNLWYCLQSEYCVFPVP